MVRSEGVLLDVSNAPDEPYRRIVEFANGVGGLLWHSPFGDNGDGYKRKKLIIVSPTTVETVTEFVECNM